MFHLTRSERVLIAGLLLAFLVGLAVQHHRAARQIAATPPTDTRDAKR